MSKNQKIKMKVTSLLAILIVICLGTNVYASTCPNGPDQGFIIFKGTATVDGNPVLQGTLIEAFSAGGGADGSTLTADGSTTTNSSGYYQFAVTECYKDDGEIISFKVGGSNAQETYPFVPWATVDLDLTVVCTDEDNDGYSTDGGICGEIDCDDSNPNINPGADELCNGLDDDCNAATDDGADEEWLGDACDGADSDLCEEGTYVCSAGSQECTDDTDDNLELCNGVDDDCNAATDDGADEPTLGNACDGLDSDLCEEGNIICSAGSLTCDDNDAENDLDLCNGVDDDCNQATADGADETWLGDACDGLDSDLCEEGTYSCVAGSQSCSDNTGNNLELCNGLDDDCNAATDDGADEPTLGNACDGLDSDLCEEGNIICSAGSLTCNDNDAENDLDLCNGLDDDCNAATDDGADETWLGDACDGLDSDLCEEGTYVCSGGSQECNDNTGDNVEVCNGLDDDCDASTDEDFADLGDACSVGVGECENSGTMVCKADETGTECSASEGTPSAELCDGLDNDCDLETDEDFPTLGDTCTVGTGACEASGNLVCAGDGSGVECDATEGTPSAETCNNIDDDCDGSTDEDLTQPTTCGVGACEGNTGEETCTAGAWGGDTCDPFEGASAEVCEGSVDEDCDGSVDEGCDCINGDTQQCGTTDVGECEYGTQTCADGAWGACEGNVEPTTETCNGLDDDCDASADEDFADLGDACSVGVGECENSGTMVCKADETGTECSASEGTPSAELCDGLDNDCDGSLADDGVDETWYNDPTACGVGECASTGNLVCTAGAQDDTCTAGTPGTEICNGLDDDCDGSTDEDGDALCDNNLACDGQETCEDAVCVDGTPVDCDDQNECTDDNCVEDGNNQGHCENSNLPFETLCGEARDCPYNQCVDPFMYYYPADGHDYCDGEGNCVEYSCEPEDYYCCDNDPEDGVNGGLCNAECDQNEDCPCDGVDGCYDTEGGIYYNDYVDYPDYGSCGGECSCDIFETEGEPCHPTITKDAEECREYICEEGEIRSCFKHFGVCEELTEDKCIEGIWVGCDYNSLADYEETEASCDGLDNDCDGYVDEGFPDLDDDGLADCIDDDDDNDGIDDTEDYIIGNSDDVSTNDCIVFEVNSQENPNNFDGLRNVVFKDCEGNILVEFEYNFTNETVMYLNNILININSINGTGSILIGGIDLTSQGLTKTVYFDNLNNITTVCIRDDETAEISLITGLCNGANEYQISCPGTANNDKYNCTFADDTNTTFKITGLDHTGIQQQTYCGDGTCNSNEDCSSCPADCGSCPSNDGGDTGGSGGGGGGGGGGSSAAYVCNMGWECTEWSECDENGWETRECSYVKVPQHTSTEPCPLMSNPPEMARKCEAVEEGTQQVTATALEPTEETEEEAVEQVEEQKTGFAAITGAFITGDGRLTGLGILLLLLLVIILGLLVYRNHRTKRRKIPLL